MSVSNMLNEIIGNKSQDSKSSGTGKGLLGGLAAGGIISLLVANKKTRKFAGKAATFGGTALLGGIAYKVYKNWQHNSQYQDIDDSQNSSTQNNLTRENSYDYQLTIIKAMIATAKADGHIDQSEQRRIFQAVEKMSLSSEDKGIVFDLLSVPISISEITIGVKSQEQKSEVYFASCVVADTEHPADRDHLDRLAQALGLPNSLAHEIEMQADQTAFDAA